MITITGASDDLIEVDGDISEEFSALDDGGDNEDNILGFSNGVLLQVRYDSHGVWRLTPLAGVDKVQVAFCNSDDDDRYSDVATITERVEWVVFGNTWAGSRRKT